MVVYPTWTAALQALLEQPGRALARRAGIPQAMWSRWHTGGSEPTAAVMRRVCGSLGVVVSVSAAGYSAARLS